MQYGASFHKVMFFLSHGLVSDFDFSYTICRFRTQTPKSSPNSYHFFSFNKVLTYFLEGNVNIFN